MTDPNESRQMALRILPYHPQNHIPRIRADDARARRDGRVHNDHLFFLSAPPFTAPGAATRYAAANKPFAPPLAARFT